MTARPTQPPAPSPAHGAATMLTDTVFPGSTQMAGQADPQLLGSERKSRLHQRCRTGSPGPAQPELRSAIGAASTVCTAGIQTPVCAPCEAARSIITLREPPFPPHAQRPAPLRSRALILSIKQLPGRMEKPGAAGGIPVIESESPYLSFAPVSCKIEQILQFERSPPRRLGGLSCSGSN